MQIENKHALVSGRQLKAARALIGWKREELATAAGLHPNAVSYWERKASIPRGRYAREPYACRKMREALENAGLILTAIPAPGVSLVSR